MNRLYRLHKPVDVHTINQTTTEALAESSLTHSLCPKKQQSHPKSNRMKIINIALIVAE